MAKATIEIDDQFIFTWDKTTAGSEAQKRRIPQFVKEFFEKNISTRTELADDNFYDKYVKKFYDGDTRVKNWAPGVSEKKYKANPEMDSLFLVELELLFSGKKLGGILYRPELTKDSKIDVKLIEVVEDNEEQCVYNFQLTGSLIWDYKSSHFKKHVEAVERCMSTWDDAKVDVRINFRDNYEVTRLFKFDEKGYTLDKAIAPVVLIDQKIVGKPEDETNLCFMLDIMPNVLTIVSNDESWKDRKSESPNWKPLNTKNIHMKCKYLNF
tara:strand:+ start:1774 stop:2577 length:804 start_codon:yes stop_codon:yes gene_type:complete